MINTQLFNLVRYGVLLSYVRQIIYIITTLGCMTVNVMYVYIVYVFPS